MLTLYISGAEYWDESAQVFIYPNAITLELEHSLVSLSKWESIWEKPFLSSENRTTEETLGYVKAMTLTPNVPSEVYSRLNDDNIEQINNYIGAKMSATWFNDKTTNNRNREVITSEVIYYWLVTANIPFICETWHLNRLFTLIRVFNQKNETPKKLSKQDLATRNRQLNEARKAQLNTSG